MEQKPTKTTSTKTATANTTVKKPVTKEHWLKNSVRVSNWVVYYVPDCTYTPEVVKMFKEHKETNVQFIVHSELTAQEAINKGRNFSPCIFQNGKLLGSVGDLENYYKRNFFSNMQQATT